MDSWLVWVHALKQLGSLTTIRSLVDVERVGEGPLAGAVCGFGGCLGTRGSLIINEAILYCYSLAIKGCATYALIWHRPKTITCSGESSRGVDRPRPTLGGWCVRTL